MFAYVTSESDTVRWGRTFCTWDGSVGSHPVSVSLSLPHYAVIYFEFIILNLSFKPRARGTVGTESHTRLNSEGSGRS